MICKIADFRIEFNNRGQNFENLTKGYLCASKDFDISIHIIPEEAEYEKTIAETKNLFLGEYACTAAFRKLSEWLPLHNAFILHSAVFDIEGTGVAFAAHSGTGKTTHMMLWQELLGDRMTVVNGDKPIVRFLESDKISKNCEKCFSSDTQAGIPYAYGTPWNGKEHLGCNMRTPLRHICFIERAEENSCEEMNASEAVDLIFNQVYMPKENHVAVMNTIQLINRLIDACSLWKIKCNMDISAAEVAYNTIFKEENK